MAGQIKVDSINADSNLALKIANTAVAFIDSSGLRPVAGNLNLDATATSKLYLPSANTVAIQTAGVTGLSISSAQVVTLANALAVTSGGTGVTTSTGTGAVVLGTSPTITGATITVAATAAPAFSAYANAVQVVSSSTFTKVTFGVEDFDTNSNFASSTFTPTVAGYYQFNCLLQANFTTTQSRVINVLYKNGAALTRLLDISVTYEAGSRTLVPGTLLAYANGTTDYFEMYGFIVGTGTASFSNTDSTNTSKFSASMVRSA